MSKRLEPKLPDRLFDLLNGENLSPNLNKVIVLVTVDGKGWPYAAILSYLEVLAPDRTNIRLAPWSNSTTTANIRSNGNGSCGMGGNKIKPSICDGAYNDTYVGSCRQYSHTHDIPERDAPWYEQIRRSCGESAFEFYAHIPDERDHRNRFSQLEFQRCSASS